MVSVEQVLRWSAELQRAGTLTELMQTVLSAVRTMTRYESSWIAWFEDDFVRVIASAGPAQQVIWETSPVIPRSGDAMLMEIASGGRIVVVDDARVDPRTNKEMVERYGSRTIINVPMILGGKVCGSLGTGTLHPQDALPPTQEELERLASFATQLGPAIDRVHALAAQTAAEDERRKLERHLESLQRVELMGVLAAGVAHDLNNLLSVALTGAQTIDRSPLSKDDGLALADTEHALLRMRDISKQLLQLGKMHAGVTQEVDLADKVSSTLALVRRSISPSVRVELSRSSTPIVRGDPVQLEQAVANLIINARDAVGSSGRITLDVGERVVSGAQPCDWRGARARPGRYGRVCVSDSGPGIPPELRERVFDPLFTTKPTGTGLGLAVVSRIIQQHEGFVSVQSAPGHGASFELYVPMA